MLKIVMIMLCGIGTGYLLRNRKMSFIGRVITALIWVLLFLLGIEVGANPHIVNGLQTLGLEAIVLTIAGSLGSAIFAWALWRYVCISLYVMWMRCWDVCASAMAFREAY